MEKRSNFKKFAPPHLGKLLFPIKNAFTAGGLQEGSKRQIGQRQSRLAFAHTRRPYEEEHALGFAGVF
jgi:hypothetical protein